MNSRLITAEEKAASRRRKDRRRRLKRVAKKRTRLLSRLEGQPQILGLLEAGLVSSDAILDLYCGRLDAVRSRVLEIQIMASAADPHLTTTGSAAAVDRELVSPARVIRLGRRGNPSTPEAFLEAFRSGIRAAEAMRRVLSLPGEPGLVAYLEAAAVCPERLELAFKVLLDLGRTLELSSWLLCLREGEHFSKAELKLIADQLVSTGHTRVVPGKGWISCR